LRARFSAVFDPDRPLPLALRVDHQLRAALGVSRSQVVGLLEWWTAQPGYIAAISAGGMRRNLDGSEAGEISDKHRAHAEKQLKGSV
jgi:sRNA-binding protein